MFVQVIEGRTDRPEELQERFERWDRDVKPGAVGYLGSTAGCTADGDVFVMARFEDAEVARRNSERPEQGAWWEETARCLSGAAIFNDTEDVHVMQHGDLDRAGFVQVMQGHVTDRSRADAIAAASDPMLAELRPDLLGVVTAYFGRNGFAELAYFTSESDARRGEHRELPDEAAEMVREWGDVMHVDRYLDLAAPWVAGA